MTTMKAINATRLFAICAAATVGLAACGAGRDDTEAQHDTAGIATPSAEAEHAGGQHAASPGPAGSTATSTRLELVSEPAAIPAGAPATWRLRITDAASGEPVTRFSTVHDKLMHLIVVSADQEWFNHIHPLHDGKGEFTIRTVLPKKGSYVLFADYAPTGRAPEVSRYELATAGEQLNVMANSPVPDTIGADGWIVKSVRAHEEGEPDRMGSAGYQIALMPMPARLVPGKDAMMHFQVRDASGNPVKDLEPYLGALGHAVLLSSDSKTYLHTHPTDGGADHSAHGGAHDEGQTGSASRSHDHGPVAGGGPDVVFHTSFPAAGLYKVWGQFMHKGKIITASFVLRVDPDRS